MFVEIGVRLSCRNNEYGSKFSKPRPEIAGTYFIEPQKIIGYRKHENSRFLADLSPGPVIYIGLKNHFFRTRQFGRAV
jgi:hypothetical protein